MPLTLSLPAELARKPGEREKERERERRERRKRQSERASEGRTISPKQYVARNSRLSEFFSITFLIQLTNTYYSLSASSFSSSVQFLLRFPPLQPTSDERPFYQRSPPGKHDTSLMQLPNCSSLSRFAELAERESARPGFLLWRQRERVMPLRRAKSVRTLPSATPLMCSFDYCRDTHNKLPPVSLTATVSRRSACARQPFD